MTERPAEAREPSTGDEHLALVWQSVFRQLADKSAHDLRNALNAVVVNLEVVRSRTARGAGGDAVAPFAATAAAQLEDAAARSEALVALARAPRGPVDLRRLLGQLRRLVGGPAGEEGLRLADPEPEAEAPPVVAADPDAARVVLTSAVLEVLGCGGGATCEIGRRRGIFVRFSSGGSSTPSLPRDVASVASRYGIDVMAADHAIELTFPSVSS